MSQNTGTESCVENEEEEVFVDAVTSPPCSQGQPNTTMQTTLRRSSRKRRSIIEVVDLEANVKTTGKRPRPLGKMHRTPEATGRRQSQAKGASPDLQKKREDLTVITDPPGKQTPEQVLLLGGLRSVLREELQKTEDKLSGRLDGVESSLSTLKKDLGSLEHRVDCLEDRIDGRIDEVIANKVHGTAVTEVMNGSVRAGEGQLSDRKDESYWRARRSLRMWPILGSGEALRASLVDFLVEKLKMDRDVAVDVDECVVRRVPTTRASKLEGEVIVEFPTIAIRDAVRGSAYNLAGQTGVGIRLEIPNHLMNNFRALNQAGYRLKQRYPLCRRNVKFDDEVCNLIMDFRTTVDGTWSRLRPEQARQLEGPSRVRDLTAEDMSQLLEGEDGGGEEEEQEEEI